MNKLVKCIGGLILFMAIVVISSAAPDLSNITPIKFQYYTTNEGLPQNTVDCILKDKRGFMWFGTWNGLSKFDGYSFTNFRSESTPAELPNNFIYTLCEDSIGNIWVGTRKGLTYYIFNENRFSIPVSLEQIFSSFTINDLLIDNSNKLWVATANNGIWIVDLKNGDSVHKVDDDLLPNRNINCFYLHGNRLFIGTDTGMGILDVTTEKVIQDYSHLLQTVQIVNVNTIFIDSSENIWVGTNYGLFQQNKASGETYEYYHNPVDPGSLNHMATTSIVEDTNHNVIIGTYSGLNYYHPETNSFSHLSQGNLENEHLNNPFVNSILTDTDGNVWIGTDKGGVNHYNSHQKPFYSLVHNPADANSLSHNTVNSILKEGNVLWVGTAGGGLNKIIGNGVRVERLNLEPRNSVLVGDNFVTAIFRGKKQSLWLGTWGAGLKRLVSNNSQNIISYVNAGDTGLSSNFVSSIAQLSDNSLLVGTESGLNIFHIDGETVDRVDSKLDRVEPLEVGCLLIDSQKRVWIGTRNGLFVLDAKYLKDFDSYEDIPLQVYLNDPEDETTIPGNYVISLMQAKDGTIWVGTYGHGICSVSENDKGTLAFVNYDQAKGLCNNVAYALQEDPHGNIWISTDKGLSKFSPSDKSFQNFFVKDGLLNDQFYWSSSYAAADGTLYFGGIGGLNYFKASDIELYQKIEKPVFTSFSIFNEPVQIGAKFHSSVILSKSISETDKLELSYKDAVISIEFSALDYFLPEKVRYEYKMEGIDQDWVEVPATRRFANYTNLSGGNYIFRVRASNSDGVWSDETAELKIVVTPPFYNTTWFRFLVVMLVILSVMAYIRYRTRFLQEQKRKLERQVLERTEQIELQKEKLEQQAFRLQRTNLQLEERQKLIEGQKIELEQQNAKIGQQRDELMELNEKVNLVNQLRLRFFTNISHEFRTPLTLIIDPIEQLMKTLKEDKTAVNTLKLVNRNAQRLLHLINQLIYFRRLETGKMNLHVSKGDLRLFLFQIYESFGDLAQHQHIDYRFDMAEAAEDTWFDGEKMENIFYNLLSNAFKYTSEGGQISMTAVFVKEAGAKIDAPHVCIEISDTGMGIEEEHMPFIFERFFQAPSEKNTNLKSSGIGLALTFELVQALRGHIDVESKKGKGSKFIVRLPYTSDRFDEKELDQTAVPAEVNLQGRVDVLLENMVFSNTADEDLDDREDLPAKSNPLVLVVEDNFDLRSFLMQTLRTEYRLIGAENGKEGLALAKKYSPDLIISDVMMPIMDGMELCSRLKKDIQTSHIPVILLTAQNMIENWIEGLETGADDYIPKPFNLQVLQARMQNLIDSRRRLKKMFSSPQEVDVDKLTNSSVDEEFLSKVYAVLEKSYQNPEFSASQFASEMFMSRSLLYKKIRAITDLNISDFINSFKLKKAVELIRENKQPISEVAFQVGFNDPKYFSRIFKKFYGMTPTEFSGLE
ncbi:hybrid sensor histidine kinase/response regulator transcription factor [Mangrovibacterium diazotrophicum]|uniref:histidine kinase n=1 Tax=Mangrovibacterium diazotrophicum TaxID=1261403 RepID=A0A419VXK6_9BACT|nr:two-component regulator propeller domain-containing protein [Mangrovibacterium diazotrophicum]RKD87958.1 signal transduction histidine kinase [Mangrovibacterium diazotrophicum]